MCFATHTITYSVVKCSANSRQNSAREQEVRGGKRDGFSSGVTEMYEYEYSARSFTFLFARCVYIALNAAAARDFVALTLKTLTPGMDLSSSIVQVVYEDFCEVRIRWFIVVFPRLSFHTNGPPW